jgi:hypothetical protein
MLNAGSKDKTYRNGNDNVHGIHERFIKWNTKGKLIPHCYESATKTTTALLAVLSFLLVA